MDPSDETPDETPDPAADVASGPRPPARRRRLDARTLGICVCIALVAAIVAALLVGALTGSDDKSEASPSGSSGMALIDTAAVLRTPMTDVGGKDTTLKDHLGDGVTLVNLWASTCKPCVKELPLLQQASKDNPEVAFLGIDTVDRLDNAKVMAERAGVTYPWVQDPSGDFGNAMRIALIPATYLFDADGTILASKTASSFKSQDQLQAWIDANT